MNESAKEPSTPYGEGGSEPKTKPNPTSGEPSGDKEKGQSGGLPEEVTNDPSMQPT